VAACLLLMLLLNPVQYRLNDRTLILQEASVMSACSLYNEPAADIPVKAASTPIVESTPLAVIAAVNTSEQISASTTTTKPASSPETPAPTTSPGTLASTSTPARAINSAAVVNSAAVKNSAAVENSAAFANPVATASGQTEELSSRGTPKYCIVVASFTNEADAQRWLEQKQLKKEFPQAGLASKEGRTRVYVLGFDQRQAALNYLADFRASDQKYAKSWVLVN
ncbi:MAG: SPOR domain-containing protein, partial [Bacteroidales bacterium]|nr:SPOR domain-containing protein [Bacteroidales bacterium]